MRLPILCLATLLAATCLTTATDNNNNEIHVDHQQLPLKGIIGLDFCPTCVSFMGEALLELINIVANLGVIASCSELCNYLDSSVEVAVCDTLCSAVGITGFIALINQIKNEPDPIYICKELEACQSRVGKVDFNSFAVTPHSGSPDAKFVAVGQYTVVQETGTGLVNMYLEIVTINPSSNTTTLFSSTLIENLMPGVYPITIAMDMSIYKPGTLTALVEICEGTCGSTWQDTVTYCKKSNQFILTPSGRS